MLETKENLKLQLEDYKGILTPEIIEYLDSIIELEFSVIQKYISDKERKCLQELQIYRKAFIHNVYNRSFKLLDKIIPSLTDFYDANTFGFETLIKDEVIELFNLYFEGFIENRYIGAKPLIITLSQYVENVNKREDEIKRIEKLIKETETSHRVSKLLYDKKEYILKRLTFELEALKNRPLDIDNKKIKISNQCLKVLLRDYGLKVEDFKKIQKIGFDSIMEEEYHTTNLDLDVKIKRKYI